MRKLVILMVLLSFDGFPVSHANTDRQIEAQLGNIEIARNVKKELDSRGIVYEVLSDLRIKIAISQAKEVAGIIEAETDKLLPPGRHDCLATDLNVKLKKRLDTEGLKYKLVTHMGWECIVWEKKDTAKFKRIIKEVVNEWKW